MKTSSATKIYGWLSGRTALCIVLLAACSASRSQLSAAIPGRSNAAMTNYCRGASWMAPDAKTSGLLYISDDGTNGVYAYIYPHIN